LKFSLSTFTNDVLYSRGLAWRLQQLVFAKKANRAVLEQVGDKYDYKQVRKARTIREVDDFFTRRLFGIDDVDRYYHQSSVIASLAQFSHSLFFSELFIQLQQHSSSSVR
jgi:predicted alpha/beta-fold hydrolase